jgi:hypothetical protein
MAPPKKPGVARHVMISPYVRVKPNDPSATVEGDARVDKALRWYDSIPKGDRQRMCWELIVAAVNGELGVAHTVHLADDDTAQAERALEDLLLNMVLEED